ncbi:unnamed protein product [Brassicogethes aeneus]|uniref:Uncharacterized protein n=1 Tax=Brassicogethes aeneus TaxID=1431903 RepID=A0A9P0FCH6_BRAAE|nr:unnamed protein product [Brassicogethes aeneus]
MISQSAQEEAKLDAMQRHWQLRRGGSSTIFKEVSETEDLLSLPLPRQATRENLAKKNTKAPATYTCSDLESDSEHWEFKEPKKAVEEPKQQQKNISQVLDASKLGDLPARYTICALEQHQFPVVGVYVDERVVPGFKYKVRPLPSPGKNPTTCKCLFDERALTLRSIGRGYARRFTFEADKNKLNDNENYFWSDNRPEGYAFELEVVSEGDKFTIFDINRKAQGTLEVLNIMGPQLEIGSSCVNSNLEKRALVKFAGKVEFFETGVAKPMPLSGTVVAKKCRGKATAEVAKILNVTIKRQRYYLVPGVQKVHRRCTVKGSDINDVPTKYTMTGLEHYEIPVVGTYVDPRIIPGFYYKVRPNDRKEHLFNGRALKLISIGMGYAKRLTFQPDSLVNPDNYLWSDSHPDGLGLEIRAVRKGMMFDVKAGDQLLGEATVFRADKPQREEKMEKVLTATGQYAIQKRIHIDVMCHFKLSRTGGASIENDEHLMRVCGHALVRKEPKSTEARIVKVENVGIDSQLNVLFAQTHTELIFTPKN